MNTYHWKLYLRDRPYAIVCTVAAVDKATAIEAYEKAHGIAVDADLVRVQP